MSTLKPLRLPNNDNDLDAYVKERGVPVLAAVPSVLVPAEVPSAPTPPKAAPTTKMAIEVPTYLPAQLKRMALERDCTIRHLILEALHQAGCEIAAEDRKRDGRRTA